MTSFNFSYLPKTLSPHRATLGVRASSSGFLAGDVEHNSVHCRGLGAAMEPTEHWRFFICSRFENLRESCKIIMVAGKKVIFAIASSHYFVELSHNPKTDKDYSFYILKLCNMIALTQGCNMINDDPGLVSCFQTAVLYLCGKNTLSNRPFTGIVFIYSTTGLMPGFSLRHHRSLHNRTTM